MLNVEKIRNDFPMYKNNPNMTYLDTAATSLKPSTVIEAMNDYYFQYGVNVHRGVYNLSYQATNMYEDARSAIAKFINTKFDNIIFTRNVSVALNMVAQLYSKQLKKGDEIISTELEHHSSVLPWQVQAKERGLVLKYIPLNEEGRITVESFKKVITPKTKVVAITYVSNVMGYITPIEEIIKIAHQNNAIVIVDAAQAVGHMKIDVQKLDCDFLAFSGHKMLGPTGIGVLYGKTELLDSLPPLDYGGDMNDEVSLYDVEVKLPPYRFEVGTPSIAEAIGLKRAIEYLESIGFDNIYQHEKQLLAYAMNQLKDIEGITVYNKKTDCGIINFNINGVHPHDAATLFDERGICLRAGHHCAQLASKWLACIGTLRASIYIYNDKEDIDRFIQCIKDTVTFFKRFGE